MTTAGEVFRDDVGELTRLRERLAYFPEDVWLFKRSSQWRSIAEEQSYFGRAGSVEDELGSRVLVARMVEKLMRLAFLIERKYAPYPKWFGKAFDNLDCASDLMPILTAALDATDWEQREKHIAFATRCLAEEQVSRKIPGAILPKIGKLHNRPTHFVDSGVIFEALWAEISDDTIKSLNPLGGPDQYISSNYVLAVPNLSRNAAKTLLQGILLAPDR